MWCTREGKELLRFSHVAHRSMEEMNSAVRPFTVDGHAHDVSECCTLILSHHQTDRIHWVGLCMSENTGYIVRSLRIAVLLKRNDFIIVRVTP